jgi:hypothetical protein
MSSNRTAPENVVSGKATHPWTAAVILPSTGASLVVIDDAA